ncbi:MAG: ADP-ribosylglycohydrolase family protein [Rubrobacteraceae bacterium]
MEQIKRCRGAMLGLAAGDALGASVEFMERGTFDPVSDMDRGTVHGNPPGSWTDDTSMALCLAESLIEKNGMNLTDQLERYVRWQRDGHMSSVGHCFDIGNATSDALSHFERTGDPHSGSTDPYSTGNGSIMRLAPVPLFFASASADEAVEYSGESSRTTHGSPEAVDACRYFGSLICAAANGMEKDELLSETFAPSNVAPKIAEVAHGSFKRKGESEIRGSGYVVRSLEAALWAFHNSETFEEGALFAVNLGDDADTTGAVYGQLAGAFYGEDEIPERWRDKLAFRETIESLADELFRLSRSA